MFTPKNLNRIISLLNENEKQTVYGEQLAPLTYEDKKYFAESLKTYSQMGEVMYGRENLQEMIDDLFTVEEVLKKTDTLLIVVKDEMNETLINTLKHIWEQDKIFIIIQSLKRLQFNLLNHVLVPPHRILLHSETIQVRTRYNIMHDGQFPDISRFDPVAQAIGIRPGQVCEIIRPSKTAISAPYYRLCL